MRPSLGRDPWQDRFSAPTIDTLLEQINPQLRPLFDAAREGLAALPDAGERLGWHGLPWRWSLTYETPGADSPAAFLVPRPARPSIAVPFEIESIRELPLRRVSKAVRDVMAHAANVGGVIWPEWDLVSANQVNEVLTLTRKRLELTKAATGAA